MHDELIEVWLVEDNDDDVLMMALGFAETNLMRVGRICRDGREFLNCITDLCVRSERLPELVLLDINMPRMNGFEVLEAMKGNVRLRHIPIVVLTSSSQKEDVVRAYAAGACSYVIKPSGYEELLGVVSEFAAYWTRVSRAPFPHDHA